MKLFRILVLALVVLWTAPLWAEDAAPADHPAAEAPAPVEAAPVAAPVLSAPPAPSAAEVLPDVENLDFASGEVVSLDSATGKLDVKIYLDAAGNANEQTMSLTVDAETEITNGETDLKNDALKAGAEIDVEYDVRTKKATYIFVY